MKTYKKLSYINTSFLCSDEPEKVNRDKILMQKKQNSAPSPLPQGPVKPPKKQQMQRMSTISSTVVTTMTLQTGKQKTKQTLKLKPLLVQIIRDLYENRNARFTLRYHLISQLLKWRSSCSSLSMIHSRKKKNTKRKMRRLINCPKARQNLSHF